MTTKNQVQCLQVPSDKRFGQFANSFRILPDTGGDFLLDFLVYSEVEKAAFVVARVRVRSSALELMRDKIHGILTEMKNTEKPETPVFLIPGNEEVH